MIAAGNKDRKIIRLLDGLTGHSLTHLKQFVRAKVLLYTNNDSATADDKEGTFEDIINETLPICVSFCDTRDLGPWVALESGFGQQNYPCYDQKILIPLHLRRKEGMRAVLYVPM